jgi:glycosyltransferase involved in cell wall biosynthesis
VSGETNVLVLRGHLTNPWELRAWQHLPDRFEVACLVTGRNAFDVSGVPLRQIRVRSLRDYLPRGRLGDLATGLTGDRYVDIDAQLAGADVVHAAELSFWFSGEAARRKPAHRYKLVVTVWETLPLLSTFRNRWARVYRERVLEAADLFLPATERARDALLLEGVEPERVEVCNPGIDLDRFSTAARPDSPPERHTVISPGRLVWEKGHQDVMRALAALRDGFVPAPAVPVRLLIVGSGPEEARLREHAHELGLAERVEFRSVPYPEMPDLYSRASCMVLASLPSAACSRYLGDLPRCFWEEQFGMVLAEAIAAGLPIVATDSGAIPEVAGEAASYFSPGSWLELARRLAEGPLARSPGTRVEHPRELVERYSTTAAAERLAAAYERVLEPANARS